MEGGTDGQTDGAREIDGCRYVFRDSGRDGDDGDVEGGRGGVEGRDGDDGIVSLAEGGGSSAGGITGGVYTEL